MSDLRAALVEQIKRDTDTLTKPEHHVDQDPCGREFYVRRIALYKEAVRDMDKEAR